MLLGWVKLSDLKGPSQRFLYYTIICPTWGILAVFPNTARGREGCWKEGDLEPLPFPINQGKMGEERGKGKGWKDSPCPWGEGWKGKGKDEGMSIRQGDMTW